MTALSRFLPIVLLCSVSAADLEISRPARPWEFLDATGPKASILGHEDGTLEAFVYPLKIFKDLRLRFVLGEHVIPAESVARRIVSRPGSYTIVYSGDEYQVRETLAASPEQPGAVIDLEVEARDPLRIDVEFTRDFQLMWPASIGTSYVDWRAAEKSYVFGADGQKFAAVLGSLHAVPVERDYLTNYSTDAADRFTLGTVSGHADRWIAFAGSIHSTEEAFEAYHRLIANPGAVIAASEKHDRDYLASGVQLTLPDAQLQAAYDWARLSEAKGMVDNPLLGLGLVAGYGPSKGVYRPGFAWFFGRDTFWTSFALTSAGDLASARAAIAFIAKFQREDGKIPHEISQSASLIPWFTQYPYGYASADATPLYIIAARNYYQASLDIAFVKAQWPNIAKAMSFLRSTFDSNGFPKNLGVGHGWVEGGPLLPVQVEFYQAACYVEAVRSMAMLAHLAQPDEAAALEAEFDQKKQLLERLFWMPQKSTYAFALDRNGKPVDQPSVLATVPMWFDLLDPDHASAMIERLSDEDHAADWGMRIISTKSPAYGPAGYHYGSVWPLFTGWASVGEYRYHAAQQALANLRANAWLALDGAGGNPTEVLSGMTYSPLSTASPHQIWSAAMIVSPLLRGLCGLESDITHGVTFAPHLPADWPGITIRGVRYPHGQADFYLERTATALQLRIVNHGKLRLHFAPAYSPADTFWHGDFDGTAVEGVIRHTAFDQHPQFDLQVESGEHIFTLPHHDLFGYTIPYNPPQLGAESGNLKLISEHWLSSGAGVELVVSGRASHVYRLPLTGEKRIASVDGAKVEGNSLVVEIPAGSGYIRKTVKISLKPQ